MRAAISSGEIRRLQLPIYKGLTQPTGAYFSAISATSLISKILFTGDMEILYNFLVPQLPYSGFT
jgi:hypothetical protein